jgi:hypothetical protein
VVVLGDLPGDARHFCWAPQKHILIASEEVDDLSLQFGVQTSPNLHGFGWVFGIHLYGLGVLVCHESRMSGAWMG